MQENTKDKEKYCFLRPTGIETFTFIFSAGQAQYSEELLAAQWNMGRKRIRNLLATLTDLGLVNTHRSRVASVMTFPCLFGWKTAEGGSIANPFIREQREE